MADLLGTLDFLAMWAQRVGMLIVVPLILFLAVFQWRMYQTEQKRRILRDMQRRRLTDIRAPKQHTTLTEPDMAPIPVYNESMPMGGQPGMMWRRFVSGRRDGEGRWWLGTFIEGHEPGTVEIDWKVIDLVDADGTPLTAIRPATPVVKLHKQS